VHPTVLYLPLLLIPLTLIAAGVCWFLSATGVFIRDASQAVTLVVQAMMFLSPLFYSLKGKPPLAQALLQVNPLTFVIEQARATMIAGQPPDFLGLVIYWAVSAVIAWLGFAWFQYSRDGFADVM
jgi:lipopolysaccharide transport system permease protein